MAKRNTIAAASHESQASALASFQSLDSALDDLLSDEEGALSADQVDVALEEVLADQ